MGRVGTRFNRFWRLRKIIRDPVAYLMGRRTFARTKSKLVPVLASFPVWSAEASRDAGGNDLDHLESVRLAKTYSSTMMSARLLRLQTTEDAQAGFGAEQLQVVLNDFFQVRKSHRGSS